MAIVLAEAEHPTAQLTMIEIFGYMTNKALCLSDSFVNIEKHLPDCRAQNPMRRNQSILKQL